MGAWVLANVLLTEESRAVGVLLVACRFFRDLKRGQKALE